VWVVVGPHGPILVTAKIAHCDTFVAEQALPPKGCPLYICLFHCSDELSGLLCFWPTAAERIPTTLPQVPAHKVAFRGAGSRRVAPYVYLGPLSENVILITSCDANQSQTESYPFPLRVNVEVREKPLTVDVPNE
jgi:hypothetical protein